MENNNKRHDGFSDNGFWNIVNKAKEDRTKEQKDEGMRNEEIAMTHYGNPRYLQMVHISQSYLNETGIEYITWRDRQGIEPDVSAARLFFRGDICWSFAFGDYNAYKAFVKLQEKVKNDRGEQYAVMTAEAKVLKDYSGDFEGTLDYARMLVDKGCKNIIFAKKKSECCGIVVQEIF